MITKCSHIQYINMLDTCKIQYCLGFQCPLKPDVFGLCLVAWIALYKCKTGHFPCLQQSQYIPLQCNTEKSMHVLFFFKAMWCRAIHCTAPCYGQKDTLLCKIPHCSFPTEHHYLHSNAAASVNGPQGLLSINTLAILTKTAALKQNSPLQIHPVCNLITDFFQFKYISSLFNPLWGVQGIIGLAPLGVITTVI